MYGTQTSYCCAACTGPFENDVKMYGTQTAFHNDKILFLFENDVKMYGTQTLSLFQDLPFGLRMM